ncbi:MAG: helix-turn-helix transcriptional regulator [Spirochaetaceae bacterium]|nr:helix-turn-helix transcriptional regulator [Spirochaetaceae bacterium]
MDDAFGNTEAEIAGQINGVLTRLREEREKARISQMELSLKAGLAQNLVNSIENGHRIPSLPTILKICWALNIEPSTLFLRSAEDRIKKRDAIIELVRQLA